MYMCEIFMGKPVRTVMARVAEVENGEVDDLALTILGHEGGGASSVQVSWSARGSSPDVIEVHGKEGTLRVGDDKTVHLHSGQGDEWTVHYVPEGRVSFTLTYENVFREFASAVMEGREPAYGLTFALHNLAIIMAAYESERVGEAVSVAAAGTTDGWNQLRSQLYLNLEGVIRPSDPLIETTSVVRQLLPNPGIVSQVRVSPGSVSISKSSSGLLPSEKAMYL